MKLALRATFARRASYLMPAALAPPPVEWQATFDQLVREFELGTQTLSYAHRELATFWRTLPL